MNARTICWVRMLQAGKDSGDTKRYKSSMLTHNNQLSTLYTYRRDHKKYEDKNKLNVNSQHSTFHVVHI